MLTNIMRRILTADDAKKRLADALRHAESGDLVRITRCREPTSFAQPHRDLTDRRLEAAGRRVVDTDLEARGK